VRKGENWEGGTVMAGEEREGEGRGRGR